MKVIKEANVGGADGVSGEDLALINGLARKELKAEEVYTFQLRLCDNEIDREWERFPRETLEALAPLFVGKSGIFDHNWSAQGQTARIYKTEVAEDPGQVTRAGDRACYLKGWAYMLRTKANEDLIAEIEGGIKKEVSVGCAVEKATCSVCGKEMGSCHHVKGRTYNGKLCWAELTGAKDAYEWSFVAVPAQRKAGVIKGLSPTLSKLAQERPETVKELAELEKEAVLGRKYLEGLRDQVAKLCRAAAGLEVEAAKSIAGKLDEEELLAVKTLLEQKGEARWGGGAQLPYGESTEKNTADKAFLV